METTTIVRHSAQCNPLSLGTVVPLGNRLGSDYWGTMLREYLADYARENDWQLVRQARRAERLWRRDTFRDFYLLRYHTGRKAVRRVVRKDLSSGVWMRHAASDDRFVAGFQPKMSGFSVRFGRCNEIVNIEAETPSTIEVTAKEVYPALRVWSESDPYQKEHRREITRQIFRNGEKDTITDCTTIVEWVGRDVARCAFSNSISFDYTGGVEAGIPCKDNPDQWEQEPMERSQAKVGENGQVVRDENGRIVRERVSLTSWRERVCARWMEPRLSKTGELLPENSLASCDDGREIPDLRIDQWVLTADGYSLASVHPYVVRAISAAFNSIREQLRPVYSGREIGNIRHEFFQDALQEIAVSYLMTLRGVSRFSGVLCGGLNRVTQVYCFAYGVSDRRTKGRDIAGDFKHSRKLNGNALRNKLSEFTDIQFPDATSEKLFSLVSKGYTQTAACAELGIPQSSGSKRMKETIALNRVLAGLNADLASCG